MMAAEGAIYPVYELMADADEAFDSGDYLASVTGYYTDTDGKLLSMPFNSSTPVLYYNKTAFAKAGIAEAPKTWPEVEAAARKAQAAGYPCGFTTGWQSWVQIENFSAWHDQPIGTKANGFAGMDTEFTINSAVHVNHIGQLAEWQKSKIFDYGGRRSDSAPKFYGQECVMYMNSSASYAGIRANAKDFEFGVSSLPYWPDISGAPQNTIIGGATLWVLRGHDAEAYKGVAQFFSYLSSAEVQADWHQFTGYLPITTAAYELTRSQGFYDENPGDRRGNHPDDGQGADPELQGPAVRQLRPDPRHLQRGARIDLGGRQIGAGRARCGRLARQRPAAQVRGGELRPSGPPRLTLADSAVPGR